MHALSSFCMWPLCLALECRRQQVPVFATQIWRVIGCPVFWRMIVRNCPPNGETRASVSAAIVPESCGVRTSLFISSWAPPVSYYCTQDLSHNLMQKLLTSESQHGFAEAKSQVRQLTVITSAESWFFLISVFKRRWFCTSDLDDLIPLNLCCSFF